MIATLVLTVGLAATILLAVAGAVLGVRRRVPSEKVSFIFRT